VQILVIVANTQMRALRTEAKKGFTVTVMVCDLVDPKD
jgi:hypothetical protein